MLDSLWLWLAASTGVLVKLALVGVLYAFTLAVLASCRRSVAASVTTARLVTFHVVDPGGSGLSAGAELRAEAPLRIGRSPECDLVIDGAHVSGVHAEVLADGPRVRIRDLGSTNGTLVEGRAVRTVTEVRVGDRVALGDVTLRLVA
ncbi:MAG: FHA domain-containing protein [Chloroflexota bacterium]